MMNPWLSSPWRWRSAERLVAFVASAALLAIAGCGGTAPSAPSFVSGLFAVTAVSPQTGPSAGMTALTLTGSGFEPGARVTIGGLPGAGALVSSATSIVVTAPAHAAGSVDVVVTNATGETRTLPAGYRYVASASMTINGLSPNIGSTAGSTPVMVSGTGFGPGTIVVLDGVRTNAGFYDGAMYFSTLPHAAGVVDVVVSNPDTSTSELVGGYTYASADWFDFNGEWEGGTGPEWATPVRFTISNDALVTLSCGSATNRVEPPHPSIAAGEFALIEGGAVIATGRITSDGHSVGTIDSAPCGKDQWIARKKR